MTKISNDKSEFISMLIKISEKLEYPINNKKQFIERLNNMGLDIDSKYVHIKIQKIDPSLVKKFVPAYYFPISDSEDFIDKAIELIGKPIDLIFRTYPVQYLFSDSPIEPKTPHDKDSPPRTPPGGLS